MQNTQAFIDLVVTGAQEFQVSTGVWASVTIAQAALETGWGTALPVDKHTGKPSNNLFGVKGTGPAGSVLCDTREVIGGRSQTVEARFRAYHSIAESIADHGAVLLQERYRPVREAITPEDACVQLYRCGYATDAPASVDGDPSYDEKLISIIQTYSLKRFDLSAGEIVIVKTVRDLDDRLARVERILATGDEQTTSSWAAAAVARAMEKQVMVGEDVTNDQVPDFCPHRPVTREELATILFRLGLM